MGKSWVTKNCLTEVPKYRFAFPLSPLNFFETKQIWYYWKEQIVRETLPHLDPRLSLKNINKKKCLGMISCSPPPPPPLLF